MVKIKFNLIKSLRRKYYMWRVRRALNRLANAYKQMEHPMQNASIAFHALAEAINEQLEKE